jgi:serine phosphatase RsbU (regulator of sigma subunit)
VAPARILIVDDEPLNVDYLEQELGDADYETISASNGQEALERIQSEAPDLVLLDIMMPVMDGFETLRRLKAAAETRNLPVIVISAASDTSNMVKGIELGAEDFLPKPFEPTLLHARISSSLERKRLHDLEQIYLKGLEREFDIAREIQRGFLPTELPQVNGWEIAAYFKAAHEVAGDFYDAFLLPDHSVAIVIGDVCGKGVGAALFMTLFRSLIRAASTTDALLKDKASQPLAPADRLHEVISFTNKYIAETHAEANMFATLFMGILDLNDGKLTYVNCGNEPPLLLKADGAATVLRPTGPVIGVFEEADYSVEEVVLEENDCILAFTDGITDAFNVDHISFGNERLLNCVTDRRLRAAAMLGNVEQELGRFVGSADQFDDITLMAVKRGG